MNKQQRIERSKHANQCRINKRFAINEELDRFLGLMEYNQMSNTSQYPTSTESLGEWYERMTGKSLDEWYHARQKLDRNH